MEENNDTSHIPTVQLASLKDEVERNMSKVSRRRKYYIGIIEATRLPQVRGDGNVLLLFGIALKYGGPPLLEWQFFQLKSLLPLFLVYETHYQLPLGVLILLA